jgi:voltage-gated potassium channel
MMNILTNIRFFAKEMIFLITSPVFILLTIVGNSFIGLCSFFFYTLEKDINPKMHHFIDALWWGFATSTTTGYGDITPVTHAGKILGMFMMLMGLALFSIYTALFADVILTSKKYKYKNHFEN